MYDVWERINFDANGILSICVFHATWCQTLAKISQGSRDEILAIQGMRAVYRGHYNLESYKMKLREIQRISRLMENKRKIVTVPL